MMLWCITSTLYAQQPTSISTQSTEQELYLEVELNQAAQAQIGHFLEMNQRLYIDSESLKNLSIAAQPISISKDQSDYIALDQITGLHYQYDPLNQKISLQVPITLLTNQSHYHYQSLSPALINPQQEKFGALLNYNVFAQKNMDSFSINGWNELRFFNLFAGTFSLSGQYQYQDSHFQQHILDTYWERDFPEKLLRLRLGDGQTNALSWTRSTRLSGLSVAKNFSLQPYTVTTPLMSFKGQVSLPSQVDLIINGIQQSSQQVLPGQYEIQTLPSITGLGNAQVLITDINGQQQRLNFSLYRATQLLAQGLNDWSFSLGYPKLNYALSSFDYGSQPAFDGSYRYGVSNQLTVETHLELTNTLYQTGLGIIYQLGQRAGQLNFSYAYSHIPEHNGQLLGLGYSWNSEKININYNGLRQFGRFNDIASLNGSTFANRSDQIYIGLNTRIGQWGASYITQDYSNQNNQYVLLNWSYILPRRIHLNLSYSHDLLNQENNYYLSLNLPWKNRRSATVFTQQSPRTHQVGLNIIDTVDQDLGGLGWQAFASHTDQYTQFQGQVDYLNRYGLTQLNVQHTASDQQDNTSIFASLNGGMVIFKDIILPTRLNNGSFAIVSTDGIKNVPVRLENRLIGTTNHKGYLLLDRLNPYQHNSIIIDTLDLPLDLKIEQTQQDAVPRQSSGVLVRFPIYQVKGIQLQVMNPNGNFIAAGTAVWQNTEKKQSASRTVVGHDGIVYIDDVQSTELYIGDPLNPCKIHLPDITTLKGFNDLGTIICQ